MFGTTAAITALWILEGFQLLVAIGLLAEIRSLRQSVSQSGLKKEHLPSGSAAPLFVAFDLQSRKNFQIVDLSPDGGILVFLSPKCTMCLDLTTTLRKLNDTIARRTVLICSGAEQDCKAVVKRLQIKIPVLLDATGNLSRRYGVSVNPTAVFLSEARKINGYAHPQNATELESLVRDLASESEAREIQLEATIANFSQ